MHEMSLCESVMGIIEGEAKRHGFFKVKTVWLEIGCLSHAEPEAMRFCFQAVAKGTMVEDATLEILRPPGQAWCLDCSETVEIGQRYDPCPKCGGHKLHVTGGEELRVHELEVD